MQIRSEKNSICKVGQKPIKKLKSLDTRLPICKLVSLILFLFINKTYKKKSTNITNQSTGEPLFRPGGGN